MLRNLKRRERVPLYHTHLLKYDAESIRILLRLYDQYSNDVHCRVQRILGIDTLTSDASRPLNLKYCLYADCIQLSPLVSMREKLPTRSYPMRKGEIF